jgi:hypothetical protein
VDQVATGAAEVCHGIQLSSAELHDKTTVKARDRFWIELPCVYWANEEDEERGKPKHASVVGHKGAFCWEG